MKCVYFLEAICLGLLSLFTNGAKAQAPADPSSIIGKVVCGYQGWFTAEGDGSPINTWSHWSIGTAPKAGVLPNPNPNLDFDVYPDVEYYDSSSLFQTNFATLGNGTSSKLYASIKQDVTDKQFGLMQKNGIDGVAFQRFIWEVLVDPRYKANRDSMAVHVRKSAEKYNRMFYLVYDLSGLGNVPAANDQARFDAIKNDWSANMVGNLQFTSSPMYAKQGGKPVVQLWGIGYNHIIGTAAIQLDLINWFKAQGCYVIIGVPTGWRTGTGASLPGWINTYNAGNMISPWAVGAYSDQASADNFKTNFLTPDLTYCNSHGIAYQPVIFPGFSWSNWNGGTQNQIPRNKGEFLWRQVTNLRLLGIKSAEIAMFDEYDEGTAIMSMADGYDMIPTDQYFVTSSADGTYLSSDFYLRLAGKASRVIKQTDASTSTVPIPYSVGPIFFRTSNEKKYDAIASGTVYLKKNMYGTPTCTTVSGNTHRGTYALKVTGTDNSTSSSYVYFNAFSVNIPVSDTTELTFWTNPSNTLGRYISVDLLFTDGTALRDAGAYDDNGMSMHPSAGRGTVGTWTKTSCKIGSFVNGKTIKTILVGYDHAAQSGTFTGYVDDISINERGYGSYSVLPLRIFSFGAKQENNDVLLQWKSSQESGLQQYKIQKSFDGSNFTDIQSQLPGKSENIQTYFITDFSALNSVPVSGKLYYRLKSIANDNQVSYSKVQVINLNSEMSIYAKVFPNPFTDKIEISLKAEQYGILNISISDINGKIILNKKINVAKGQSVASIDNLANLPKGIYFIKTSLAGRTATFKIEK
jgi:hypothetical protein